ncbi:hypothetical protein CLOSTHATH_04486 [Hungatella hathewayi DSM 13479]|uniref:Uncharacterized protein n=1 Tax=Hungatella hathewayi DSM 13479 TaxID=566550 RepID=D3ALI9_9FIRM|nr:hypothetical protein CLOSTHATH_04486 [Hungatella hathewayi DSM 13479]
MKHSFHLILIVILIKKKIKVYNKKISINYVGMGKCSQLWNEIVKNI